MPLQVVANVGMKSCWENVSWSLENILREKITVARIKHLLQGVSVVTVLGFGGYALYYLVQAIELKSDSQAWYETNGAWYAEKCAAQLPEQMTTRLICQEAWGRKAYHDVAPAQAMDVVKQSLGLALIAPMMLLILVLFTRLRPAR